MVDHRAQVYVDGFKGLMQMGQLGRLPVEEADTMISAVSETAPETAKLMRREFETARFGEVFAFAAAEGARAVRGRQDRDDEATARRCGMTVAELDRVRAGGHDREVVEARAAMYRR